MVDGQPRLLRVDVRQKLRLRHEQRRLIGQVIAAAAVGLSFGQRIAAQHDGANRNRRLAPVIDSDGERVTQKPGGSGASQNLLDGFVDRCQGHGVERRTQLCQHVVC